MLARTRGCEIFAVRMQDLLAEHPKESEEAETLRKLPQEYYEYADVFSKAAADKLLLHRPSDY